MEVEAALDNDVIIKCSCYAILDEVVAGLPTNGIGILGSAPYVVRHRIGNKSEIQNPSAAMARFDSFLSRASILEPSAPEIELATALEEIANLSGLQVDTGESQLCAIAVVRSLQLLVTGDKRAIQSLESLRSSVKELDNLRGKVGCLEQLLLGIALTLGASETRARVCSETLMDRALSICFECSGEERSGFNTEGLESYINDMRKKAPEILVAANTLFKT